MKFNVNAVLVRSKYASNIGASARAAANMGAQKLILIDPQTDINSKAKQGAAGAQSYLENRTSYSDWDHFYQNEGHGIRIGLTRRDGRTRQTEDLEKTLHDLHQLEPQLLQQPIYLFFGPEDHGLNSDDLALMNRNCSLPIEGEFKSINLSQAVLLTLFITCQFLKKNVSLHATTIKPSKNIETPFSFPENLLQEWLTTMGFNLEDRRISAYTVLRDLLLHSCPKPENLQILEKIIQQNIRLLKENKK